MDAWTRRVFFSCEQLSVFMTKPRARVLLCDEWILSVVAFYSIGTNCASMLGLNANDDVVFVVHQNIGPS
jgi:hypothetical protein